MKNIKGKIISEDIKLMWATSFEDARQKLKEILKKYNSDYENAIQAINNSLQDVGQELARLRRILGTIELKERKPSVNQKIKELTDQIDMLIKIQNLYAIERLNIQKNYTKKQKDFYDLVRVIEDILSGIAEITDKNIKREINNSAYLLSVELIEKCLRKKKKNTFVINEAIKCALEARRAISPEYYRATKNQKPDFDAEILAELFVRVHPSSSKEHWKSIILEAIKAILFGITSAAVWTAISSVCREKAIERDREYKKIFLVAKKEAKKRGSLKEFNDLTNSKKEAEDIFRLLFEITF